VLTAQHVISRTSLFDLHDPLRGSLETSTYYMDQAFQTSIQADCGNVIHSL
jgi:hypothetical protein